MSAFPPRRLAGLRILAAEDNEVNRIVLAQMLELEGAVLTYVEDGRALVERVALDGVNAWDIILTDVQMPEMDGIEAAKILAKMAPELPVVALSAHARPEQRALCLEAGMVAHVTKPVDVDVLVETIAHHARRRPDAAVVTPPPDPIDRAALSQRYPGKAAFVERILGLLAQNLDGMSAKLRAAAEAGDLPELRTLSHGLKSMAGNVFARPVCELATATDLAAREGDTAAVGLARALATAVDELLEALRADDVL